ncbi:MAG: hypothetical protein M3416_15545 [Acidobacteriota bacterium]|nr:hypothetical protein [Acidobacteriota bacterium]
MSNQDTAEIPRRPLGRTGETVSAVALGGFHLGLVKTERKQHKFPPPEELAA